MNSIVFGLVVFFLGFTLGDLSGFVEGLNTAQGFASE